VDCVSRPHNNPGPVAGVSVVVTQDPPGLCRIETRKARIRIAVTRISSFHTLMIVKDTMHSSFQVIELTSASIQERIPTGTVEGTSKASGKIC
jgi:hypothetical protein